MTFRQTVLNLIVAAVVVFGGTLSVQAGAPKMLHPEPWMHQTSGDLSKDLAAASAEGKILVVFWEQEGCHYCAEMHEVNFQQPDILAYIKKHFYSIQLDMRGEGGVVDLAGKSMSESALAHDLQVRGTPTTIFYAAGKEVARMPGYGKPLLFKKVFEYVREKGYQEAGMIDWIRARLQKETEG